VSIFVGKFTIAFYLDWSDQCREQLEQIAAFLRSQGIRVGVVRKQSNSAAFGFRIGDGKSVIEIAERITPFCFKKRKELLTLLEYRKLDLITGSEVQHRFEQLVNVGMRERHGNRSFRPMPWTYSVGYHLSRKSIGLLSHRYRLFQALSEAQKQEAMERHNVFGESISALARSYGISRSAMWRLLRNE